jgi:hypothetical protein
MAMKKNGVDIAGAQSKTYNDFTAGTFTCSISNSCGTFLSHSMVMQVDTSCTSGMQFDGSNDRVTIPDSSVYNVGTGDFTAEAWIKADITQTSTNPVILGKRAHTTSGFLVSLYNGQLLLRLATGNNLTPEGPDLRDNICHHIAVVRSGTIIYYYLDGVMIYGANGNGSLNWSLNNTHAFWIGNDEFSPNPFQGIIYEVRYWKVARTLAQVQAARDTLLTGSETGLAGYWRLNDGTSQSAHDYSVVNHDGLHGVDNWS